MYEVNIDYLLWQNNVLYFTADYALPFYKDEEQTSDGLLSSVISGENLNTDKWKNYTEILA